MRTDSIPRSPAPQSLPSAPTDSAVTGAARSDFSRVPRAAGTRDDVAGLPLNLRTHEGAPLFRADFSRSFARACEAAQAALHDAANIEHVDATGRLAPAARDAIYRLVSIVALKSSDDHASVAARWAFAENRLTPQEQAAWMDFCSRLPASFAAEASPSASWKTVDESELRAALAQDSALAQFIDQPDGRRFVAELAQALNAKSAEMKFSDKGFAFTMQFAHAYGVVNHIAGGSVWREPDGTLQLKLIHQESFPPTKDTGNIAVGRVYDRLDTASDHPEKRSTMVESMKLAGMPTVNLYPAPDVLVPFTQLLMAVGHHPYGPTADWNGGNRGKLPPQRAFECCFDVTVRAMNVMHNLMAERVHLLPDNLERMRHYASNSPGQFDSVSIEAGKGRQTVKMEDMRQLDFRGQYAVFKEVGSQWGRTMPWDVNRQTDSMIRRLPLQPGQQGIALDDGQRFKFIDRVPGLMLDGAKVGPERAYTADDARRMTYAGEKPLNATVVITTPRSAMQAKL